MKASEKSRQKQREAWFFRVVSKQRRELRDSTAMAQMVQSLRSPLMDGREQLMMRSESPAMAVGYPLAHLSVSLNPSSATS